MRHAPLLPVGHFKTGCRLCIGRVRQLVVDNFYVCFKLYVLVVGGVSNVYKAGHLEAILMF